MSHHTVLKGVTRQHRGSELVGVYLGCRYMHRRGYVGSIKLDYQSEKMEMKVKVDEAKNKSSIVKDMKSLSGGERSFTTVCFMLALANNISSPFHCMDEFDIFMDPVNRMVTRFGMCSALAHLSG